MLVSGALAPLLSTPATCIPLAGDVPDVSSDFSLSYSSTVTTTTTGRPCLATETGSAREVDQPPEAIFRVLGAQGLHGASCSFRSQFWPLRPQMQQRLPILVGRSTQSGIAGNCAGHSNHSVFRPCGADWHCSCRSVASVSGTSGSRYGVYGCVASREEEVAKKTKQHLQVASRRRIRRRRKRQVQAGGISTLSDR